MSDHNTSISDKTQGALAGELEMQIATRADGKRFVYIAGLPKGREYEFIDIVARMLSEERDKHSSAQDQEDADRALAHLDKGKGNA